MSGQIIAIRSIAIAAPLLVWGVGIGVPANTARADDCLTAPNSDAPKGQHWYYHTDRKKGRKCWFLRALPGTHADAVKKAATVGNAPPLPPLKPQSASASNATTREPVGQEQSAAPSAPDAPASQASVWTQPGAQAPAHAPVAASVWADAPTIVWPDPPKIATVAVQKPNSVPSNARPDTVPAAVEARTSQDSESAVRGGLPTVSAAQMAAPPGGTLVETSLVVALGLIAGGLLYRLVMKISAVRGPRMVVDHAEAGWIDDRRAQPHGLVNEREAFIDGAQLSLVPAAGDYSASRPLRADSTHQNYAPRKGRASRITEQVIERENTLVQLMRDLDQMLQSRKGA
jgi:hypothetical protein